VCRRKAPVPRVHTRLPLGTWKLTRYRSHQTLTPCLDGGWGRHTGPDAPQTAAWRLGDCAHSTDTSKKAAATLAAHSVARTGVAHAKQVPGQLVQVGKWLIDAGRSRAGHSSKPQGRRPAAHQEPDAGTARG
jgi:hypothetical protein